MHKIIESKEINHRIDFSLLCNLRGVRVAVEIGTDQGMFAKQFMERFNGEKLLCIDPYCEYEELPTKRFPDMMTAVLALMPWHGRVRFLQTTSKEAAETFPWWLKEKVDFVYVDGMHDYESVKDDLNTWWPLVSDQGIIAGHDFDDTHPGVKKAVEEFAKEKGLVIRIVAGDSPESWYAYKNEPRKLMKAFFRDGESNNSSWKGFTNG